MAQGLMVRDQEQVGEWDEVWVQAEEEWEEIVLEQVPPGIVFAPVVGQRFRMKWVFPATT